MRPIDRGLFLKVRCAYIRTMTARGESVREIMGACNLGDEGQVRLIAQTDPYFFDGTVMRDLKTLFAELTPEQQAELTRKPRKRRRQ